MLSTTALATASAVLLLTSSAASGGITATGQTPVSVSRTLVVAADGTGDYPSISEAVDAAADGDTVAIRPGTYTESIVISKDITLTGDGPREDIVLTADGGPILRLVRSESVVRGVTFSGSTAEGVQVVGGAPRLYELTFDAVGEPWGPGLHCETSCDSLAIGAGSFAIVRDNTFVDGGGIWAAASAPVIQDNELHGGPVLVLWSVLDGTTVRDNTITGATGNAVSIYLGDSRPLVEDNTITGAGASGISVGLGPLSPVDPIIRGNAISGAQNGITVMAKAQPTIEDNHLFANGSAIVVSNADPTIRSNEISDNGSGVFVMWGSPVLEDNVISGGQVGLGVGTPGATPILRGNTIVGNATNVERMFGAPMPEITGNRVGPIDAEVVPVAD